MTNRRVSDITRSGTWEMMLDLERQVRYYPKLADRYMLWYRVIRFVLLFGILTEGAVVYFISTGAPQLLWPIAVLLGLLLGVITMLDAISNCAEKAANLRAVHLQCDDLKAEAERLWRDIESDRVQDDEAEDRYNGIADRWSKAVRMIILSSKSASAVTGWTAGRSAG